jgi:hypothetical protein
MACFRILVNFQLIFYYQVLPNFSSDPLPLFTGFVGPFEAGIPIQVPLWLGVYLKRRHKCKIIVSIFSVSIYSLLSLFYF